MDKGKGERCFREKKREIGEGGEGIKEQRRWRTLRREVGGGRYRT